MSDNLVKKASRWLLLILLGFSLIGFVSTTVGHFTGYQMTTVHAKDKKDKDKTDGDDKDKGDDDSDSDKDSDKDKSSSDSGSSAENSQWNDAVSTLSSTASDDKASDKSKNDDKNAAKDQADLNNILNNGGSYLNAWGFMGPSNDIWEKENNSASKLTYGKLITNAANTDNDQKADAYKQSARFAYVLHMTGLDQASLDGYNGSSTGTIQSVLGNLMKLAQVALGLMQGLFDVVLKTFSMINPINWVVYGSQATNNPAFNSLADTVHAFYAAMKGFGFVFFMLFFAIALGFGAAGIQLGKSAKNTPVMAMLNACINWTKRIFVVTLLPLMCAGFLGALTNNLQNEIDTGDNSVPNFAIYGSMVNYNDWVMKSRLAIPNAGDLQKQLVMTSNPKNVFSLSHQDILDLNAYATGNQDLIPLANRNNGRFGGQAFNASSKDGVNNSLNTASNSMLNSWSNGSSMTAADYASGVDGYILPQLKAANQKGDDSKDKDSDTSKLSDELTKTQYNNNAGNNVVSGASGTPINDNGIQVAQSGILNPKAKGGLSTLGTYTYLLTAPNDTALSISNTDKLNDQNSMPVHRSVVLVGSSAEQLGNLIWAAALIFTSLLLSVGFFIDISMTLFQLAFGAMAATIQAGTFAISAGIKLVAVVFGGGIGLVISTIMYAISSKFLIALADILDQISSQQFAPAGAALGRLVNPSGTAELGGIAAGLSVNGVVSALYGLLLIAAVIALLKFNGSIKGAMGAIIDEFINKVAETFSSLQGQDQMAKSDGSAERLASSGSNASNAFMSKVSSTAMTVLGGATALGAATGHSMFGGMGDKGKGDSNDKAGKSATDKEKSQNSSANHKGNAAAIAAKHGNSQPLNNSGKASGQSQGLSAKGQAKNDNAGKSDKSNVGVTGDQARQNSANQGAESLAKQNGSQTNGQPASSAHRQDAIGQGRQSQNVNANGQPANRQDAAIGSALKQNDGLRDPAIADNNQQNENRAGDQNLSQDGRQELNRDGDLSNLNDENSNLDNSLSDAGKNDNLNDDSQFNDQNAENTENSNLKDEQVDDQNLANQGDQNDTLANNADSDELNNSEVQNQNTGLEDQYKADDGVDGRGQLDPDEYAENNVDNQSNLSEGNQDSTLVNDQNANNNLGDQTNGDNLGDSRNDSQNAAISNAQRDDHANLQNAGDNLSQSQNGDSNLANHQDANTNLGDQALRNNLGNTVNGDQNASVANSQNAQNNVDDSSRNNALGGEQNIDADNGMTLGATNADSTLNDNSVMTGVNNSISPLDVQNQMNDVQNAHQQFEQAHELAQANPDNSALNDQAETAQSRLSDLQNSAIQTYDAQPVSADVPQSQWVNDNALTQNVAGNVPQQPLSVGQVDQHMNAVYQAQQNYESATKRFGNDISNPRVQQAQQSLQQAQSKAVNAGLSDKVVNDPQTVANAHSEIQNNIQHLKRGSWQPTKSGAAATDKLMQSGHREGGL